MSSNVLEKERAQAKREQQLKEWNDSGREEAVAALDAAYLEMKGSSE